MFTFVFLFFVFLFCFFFFKQKTAYEMRISDWSSDVCSSDLRITIYNRAAEALFGYSGEEIAGQPLDVLLSSHVVASHRHHMRDSETALRVNERVEIVGRRKTGAEFRAEAALAQVLADGNPTSIAVTRDVARKTSGAGKGVQ